MNATDNKSLLTHWRADTLRSQKAHYSAGNGYSKWHNGIGIPATIASTIVGTAVFTTLAEETNLCVKLFIGFLSVSAAILVALQTFLRFDERANKHKAAGSRYGSIKREIDQALVSSATIDDAYMTAIRERIDAAGDNAPDVPEKIWVQFLKEIPPHDMP